jgi:hypothetical protein
MRLVVPFWWLFWWLFLSSFFALDCGELQPIYEAYLYINEKFVRRFAADCKALQNVGNWTQNPSGAIPWGSIPPRHQRKGEKSFREKPKQRRTRSDAR